MLLPSRVAGRTLDLRGPDLARGPEVARLWCRRFSFMAQRVMASATSFWAGRTTPKRIGGMNQCRVEGRTCNTATSVAFGKGKECVGCLSEFIIETGIVAARRKLRF